MNIMKNLGAWTARVGEKGQIVIPKQAREMFDIKPGDTLLILGDSDRGLAIMSGERMAQQMSQMFGAMPGGPPAEETPNKEADDDDSDKNP